MCGASKPFFLCIFFLFIVHLNLLCVCEKMRIIVVRLLVAATENGIYCIYYSNLMQTRFLELFMYTYSRILIYKKKSRAVASATRHWRLHSNWKRVWCLCVNFNILLCFQRAYIFASVAKNYGLVTVIRYFMLIDAHLTRLWFSYEQN